MLAQKQKLSPLSINQKIDYKDIDLLKYSIFSIKLEVFRIKKCYLSKVFYKTLIRSDFLGSVF